MKRTKLKKRTKRNKKRTIKRKRQNGGGKDDVKINISFKGQSVVDNLDLTNRPEIYREKPRITIAASAASARKYLLTLTDPDARESVGKKCIWTHYVAELNSDGTVVKEYYPYQPPSPPNGTGIHHYIFNLYTLPFQTRPPAELSPNGCVYYKQVLLPVIKNLTPIETPLTFIVKAAA